MKNRSTVNNQRSTIFLSVVLATKNEENNIATCLKSVKGLADEIIIFDEASIDDTTSIAKSFGAEVFKYTHKNNFHETKQKAIDKAKGKWILQLDADERVSKKLAKEIKEVILSENSKLKERVNPIGSAINDLRLIEKIKLFTKHESLIRKREGHLGKPTGEVAAFFIPRMNFFLGKPLIYAGVYPDAVIRLFKKGKARLPAKSVHEVMEVDGEVGWLFNDLEHHESPTLSRYIERANRYTSITAKDFGKKKERKNALFLVYYSLLKPSIIFVKLFVRHRGYKDGIRGFLWSMFSALHHPLAYWKYWVSSK